jgi:penicillin-binding protein 1A
MGTLLQEVTRSGTAANAQPLLKRPDCTARPGTTNDSMDAWFAGFHPSLVGVVWIGYDNPRKLGDARDRRRPGPAGVDRHDARGPQGRARGAELEPPAGVVQQEDGLWVYEEFSGGGGVRSVGLDQAPPRPPSTEERNSILDLFRR